MFWIITILVFVLSLAFYKIRRIYQHFEEKGVDYIKPNFLFGNVMSCDLKKESFYTLMQKFYEAFPTKRYMGFYNYLTPVLIIRDPELIKSIFVKDFDHFPAHIPFVPDGADPLWSKNLFLLKGAEWRHMRSTLSPSFTANKMRILFSAIVETVDIYTDYFLKNNITKIGIKDTCTRFTNDTIATVAYGIKTDSINNKSNDFYEMSKKFSSVGLREKIILFLYSILPGLTTTLGVSLNTAEVREFFTSIILETIRVREEKGIYRPDMISLLIEEKKKMQAAGNDLSLTNEEIVCQAFVFLFAGFDTVSSALSFCLYEIARNPDVQAKLHDEIDETLQENGGKITYEGLMKMKYIEQVVTESLRLWPPALASDRVCAKTYVIEPINPSEKRIVLNPGDIVQASAPGIQRDPKYYSNPYVFDPERFSDENKDHLHPYTFIPFGVGPRSCIGMRLAMMEIKTFIFQLLVKYRLVTMNDEPIKLSTDSLDLRIDGDYYVEIKPRK
ncbi:cytochrome P450 9e2-like [Onthophagus taurus]|uniref:cytochrome P450 9e2-like n=1 Tax=Onthophagus taurus TaxID=166361 RepID=UPI000C20024D|nr:cytochrome P450 9e2-like [Onthophagus taurus]